MDFIRRLWRGLTTGSTPAERFQPYYIRPKRCPEVVMVRVDLFNDLSATDEGGFFVRKGARGERCPFAAELHIVYDKNRQPVDITVENGEQVSEAEYQSWLDNKGQA